MYIDRYNGEYVKPLSHTLYLNVKLKHLPPTKNNPNLALGSKYDHTIKFKITIDNYITIVVI